MTNYAFFVEQKIMQYENYISRNNFRAKGNGTLQVAKLTTI